MANLSKRVTALEAALKKSRRANAVLKRRLARVEETLGIVSFVTSMPVKAATSDRIERLRRLGKVASNSSYVRDETKKTVTHTGQAFAGELEMLEKEAKRKVG